MVPEPATKCNYVAFAERAGRIAPVNSLPLLGQIILACLLGGLLSVAAAALVMFGLPRKWLGLTVSFSTGLLLATSTLHLLPEALESGLTPHEVFPLLLGGILAFFMLEKFALWRHAHSGNGESDAHQGEQLCDDHTHSHHHHHAGSGDGGTFLILVGDGFHNFTDGLLIAAAFLADPLLGWSTTIAIIAHEVPQEAGDFAILLAAGWKRGRALFWNGVSSLTAVAGGIIGHFALDNARGWIPYIITIAAASFLYIAIADLMPRLKRETRSIGWHGLLLAAGIAIVVFGTAHSH
jgi:zinc and cadmium transporter